MSAATRAAATSVAPPDGLGTDAPTPDQADHTGER